MIKKNIFPIFSKFNAGNGFRTKSWGLLEMGIKRSITLISAKIFLLGGLAFEAVDIVGDMKCFVAVVVSGFFGFCGFKLLP